MDTSRWGLPVRRVEVDPRAGGLDPQAWPVTVPAVAQLLRDGLDLGPATVLVGENGAGESTVLEGVAWAHGLDSRGGTVNTRALADDGEPDPLGRALRVVRGPGSGRWGSFLRAETMHQVFDTVAGGRDDPGDVHAMSHGEAFTALLGTRRFDGPGFSCFDEPESALSFTSQLALLAQLTDVVATETRWDDLPLVAHWRAFLDDPRRYLRHL